MRDIRRYNLDFDDLVDVLYEFVRTLGYMTYCDLGRFDRIKNLLGDLSNDFQKYLSLLRKYIDWGLVRWWEAPNYLDAFLFQYTDLYLENEPKIAKLYIKLLYNTGRQSIYKAAYVDTLLSFSYRHTDKNYFRKLLSFAMDLETKGTVSINMPERKLLQRFRILKERFNRMWFY